MDGRIGGRVVSGLLFLSTVIKRGQLSMALSASEVNGLYQRACSTVRHQQGRGNCTWVRSSLPLVCWWDWVGRSVREGGTSFSGRLVGNSGVSGLMLLGIPSVFLVGCSISVQISVWDPAHQYQRLVSSSLTFTSVTPRLRHLYAHYVRNLWIAIPQQEVNDD